MKKKIKKTTKNPTKKITFNDILIRYRREVLPVTNCYFSVYSLTFYLDMYVVFYLYLYIHIV